MRELTIVDQALLLSASGVASFLFALGVVWALRQVQKLRDFEQPRPRR